VTEHDRQPFAELMLGIGETYGEPVSATRMEIYFRALCDLSLEQLRDAASLHVRSQKFFPRPSELRDAIDGTVEDQAEIAWTQVQALVRRCGFWWREDQQGPIPWPDDTTRRAALELYGGWQPLCEKLPAAGPEMLGTAKLFKAHYAAFARQRVRAALPGPSRAEAKLRLSDLTRELDKRGLPTGTVR
jgi:hypothetical protein